ncbi:MAG: type II toxin-antitoxin system VapB family antitoxin [Chitinophagales bacterium]|nr:type II toxin-antitoxin system VapB family antitoxin [Chitinophagales bacterium]
MRISIDIDTQLMEQALQLSQLSTKKEVVNIALKEFVMRLRRLKMLELEGKIEWEGNLDEMRAMYSPKE